jgi:hypothetical protein
LYVPAAAAAAVPVTNLNPENWTRKWTSVPRVHSRNRACQVLGFTPPQSPTYKLETNLSFWHAKIPLHILSFAGSLLELAI